MTAAFWTNEDIEKLRAAYACAASADAFDLDAIASNLGRSRASVASKASQLKITNNARKASGPRKSRNKYATDLERKEALSIFRKNMWNERPHPRGMAGKTHSADTVAAIAEKSKERFADMTQSERDDYATKRLKAAFIKNGHLGPKPGNRAGASWKAGWREIGESRKYYRSRWEANYARYLEWLRTSGQITAWRHEPETFWFEAIKRGVRSYLPDFEVIENDGRVVYHEVKGWMDARSKTTIARFGRYYPQHKLIVIDGKSYSSIAAKVGRMIEGWE